MRRLAAVGIALAGIVAIVEGLNLLAYPVSFLTGGLDRSFALLGLVSLVPSVLCFALGWFLIRRRERLAERWFTDAEVPGVPEIGRLVRGALVIMGVWLLVTSIPATFTFLMSPITALVPRGQGFEGPSMGYTILSNVPGLVGRLITIGLAAVLIARSTQLTGWLLRPRGVPPETGPADTATCPTCGTPYDPADYRGGIAPPRCEECSEPLGVTAE
jgi:hypothetical protein